MVDVEAVKAGFASSRLDMARFTLILWFIVEQQWRYMIEKELESDDITAKQWLMMIVTGNAFQSPPSIQEVANIMSTTHQNVKQIAAGMERRGLVTLDRDPDNRRIIRLKVTDKCRKLFIKREENDVKVILRMFENLSDEELTALFNIIAKLEGRTELLYTEAKKARLGN